MGKYLKGSTVLVILAGVAIVSFITTAILVDRSLKENLITRANTIASLLSTMPISTLQGDETDLSLPGYKTIKNKLIHLHALNKDSRFLYIVKAKEEKIIFLVDSELSDSPDYSPPGQIYEEVTPHFRTAVLQGLSGWEISVDRWGAWMTGYAPLYNEQTGQYFALVGIDLDFYRNYLFPIIGYSLIPLFVFVILVVLIFYWRKLEDIEKEIATEKDQLIRIAHHEFGTPIAEYGWTCQQLMSNKAVINDPAAYAMTKQMYISLHTLIRRTTNLLKTIELTAPHPFTLSLIDTLPLLKEAVNAHKKLAEIKNKKIIFQLPFPEQAFTKGNSSALQTVFTNLILHSLFYAKPSGTVEVSYKEYDNYHEFIALSAGDTLRKNESQHLFSAYHKGETLSSHTESTGLGLYLIHKIVTMHNGKVTATTDSQGVSLCILLPKA